MTQHPFRSEWLRGVLGLAVLRVVAEGPTYGYAISTALSEHGFGQVKGGTLYPLLSRYEASGHVTSQWQEGDGGPGRKYYALTDSGRDLLAREAVDWAEFARRMTALITAPLNEGLRP